LIMGLALTTYKIVIIWQRSRHDDNYPSLDALS
jgi:hypothetical protein